MQDRPTSDAGRSSSTNLAERSTPPMNDTLAGTAPLYTCMPSPVGELLLAGDGTTLRLVGFPQGPRAAEKVPSPDWRRDDAAFDEPRRQLAAWFAGELRHFDLPLDLRGSDFQVRVWKALADIPYGQTCSYGALAARLGEPSAGRAVGAANGRNPLPIVLPCHRVIGADGSLTGFGGGLAIKRRLLEHEATVTGTGGAQLALF